MPSLLDEKGPDRADQGGASEARDLAEAGDRRRRGESERQLRAHRRA
jgi:hypothetical protein